MITLCVPTLKRYDLLEKLLASAIASRLPPDHMHLIDNGRGLSDDWVSSRWHGNFTLEQPPVPMSLAHCWNTFLDNHDDHIIIANDDVVLHDNTVERMVEAAETSPDGLFFFPGDAGGNAWSLFLQRKRSLEIVGKYDEQFTPAYYEDNDYSYRLKLAGYRHIPVPNCSYDHLGSATLKAYGDEEREQHHRQFRANTERYIEKWGGLPGHERFRLPTKGHLNCQPRGQAVDNQIQPIP